MKKIIILTIIFFLVILFFYIIGKKEEEKEINLTISKSQIGFNKINFAGFVGFATSHSLWSIEDGEMLLPFYAYYKEGGIYIERVESDFNEKSVEYLREIFKKNINNYEYSLISYDGYLTFQKPDIGKVGIETNNGTKEIKYGKKEAIYIEAKNNNKNILIAIPYNSANDKKGFIIYKPKFIEYNIGDNIKFLEDFYNKGIYSHNMFGDLYNKYLEGKK